MNHFITLLTNYLEEIRIIGIKDAGYKAWTLFNRYSGLSEKRYPVKKLDESFLLDALNPDVPVEPSRFYSWWQEKAPPFFYAGDDPAPFYPGWLGDEGTRLLIEDGHSASLGRIKGFRKIDFDYGHPPDWGWDPLNKIRISLDRHGTGTFSRRTGHWPGDIKCVWEIGRFLHLADIIRGFKAGGPTLLIDRLFEQLASFARANPLHQGPHWAGEQEAGIRTAMLSFTLYALKNSGCLDGSRVRLLWLLISAGAEYCLNHINYARYCVYNNHLIGGALGLYMAGLLVPVHIRAPIWKKKGRRILLDCLKRQWYEDGGYIQPSHNYHRLAWGYLLWALRLAEIDHDPVLKKEILAGMAPAFKLLISMVDDRTGRLPNWGPNDGACFVPLTNCDYADFRPLLASLSYALYRKSPFGPGPWDEMLFWLWGPEALGRSYEPPEATNTSYPKAGLHLLVQPKSKAVLRCGPVLSRFGQQADQLHLDVWHEGENVLPDAGSYLYHSQKYHEWFRSTSAHNTVVIDGKSQMEPYRKFLFLKWPKVKCFNLPKPPPGIHKWILGGHDGYLRLPGKVLHYRLVCDMNDDRWLVVDLLKALETDREIAVDQCWHFPDRPIIRKDRQAGIVLPLFEYGLAWSGSLQVDLRRASHVPLDGWSSRYYGHKAPSPTIHLTREFKAETMIATVIGPFGNLDVPEVDLISKTVMVGNIHFKWPRLRQP